MLPLDESPTVTNDGLSSALSAIYFKPLNFSGFLLDSASVKTVDDILAVVPSPLFLKEVRFYE